MTLERPMGPPRTNANASNLDAFAGRANLSLRGPKT